MLCRGQHDDNSHGCYYNQEQAKMFFYDDFRYGLLYVYMWNKANTEFMYFYDLIVSVTNVRTNER